MSNPTFERIQAEIDESPVMLYMKGTAMFPQCGFSARVVQILTHMNVPFKTANVLEDMELREGIKEFVTEMFQSGELETLLAEKDIPHTAAG
jgi:monothiol glutaredoxin